MTKLSFNAIVAQVSFFRPWSIYWVRPPLSLQWSNLPDIRIKVHLKAADQTLTGNPDGVFRQIEEMQRTLIALGFTGAPIDFDKPEICGASATFDPGMTIEDLELGIRITTMLKRAGVQTLGELLEKSEDELGAIPNFCKMHIDVVVENLGKHFDEELESLTTRGLTLRED